MCMEQGSKVYLYTGRNIITFGQLVINDCKLRGGTFYKVTNTQRLKKLSKL